MEEIYDVAIIGMGPAGLTAGIYAGRYLLKTIIIGEMAGGTIAEAHKICNFPTYKEITGMELSQKMIEQVKEIGVEVKQERVEEISKNELFEIKTTRNTYKAKTVIIATGSKKRKLNIKGEDEFLGRGVSYCATCDAGFYKDKIVAVVGGGDAALTAALLLAEYANKVYIIYRKEKFFRAEPTWIKQVESNPKIHSIFKANIKEIQGEQKVEKLILDNGQEVEVDGIFIEIGLIPITQLAESLNVELEEGHIKVDKEMKTSVEGVYAAGDITNGPLKQAITAAADGAIAATSAYNHINEQKN